MTSGARSVGAAHTAHVPFGEFQQWHVAAAPGHPFLKAVIERVLRNIQTYNRGLHGTGAYAVLRVTGPVAYTLAIEPLLARHPHRIVDSKRDLGLVYSVFDSGAARSHESMFPHYAKLEAPLVRENLAGRLLSIAARAVRLTIRGGRAAAVVLRLCRGEGGAPSSAARPPVEFRGPRTRGTPGPPSKHS